jgi:hypothetical protein
VLVVIGLGAVLLAQRDSSDTVASGGTFGLIPPADATDVTGAQVDGSAGITFAVDDWRYGLTQADGFGSADQLEAMMGNSDAQATEVDGVGLVYVQCAGEGSAVAGQQSGSTWAAWLDGALFLILSVDGEDTGRACLPAPDGSTPLIETVRSLRPVGETQWQAYATANGFEDFTGPKASEEQCLSAGSGEVCAERSDSVAITASGLQPGSTFTYEAEGPGRPESSVQEVTVTGEGELPGAIGLISMIPTPVTITVSATSADGQPITGSLVVP